MRLAGGTASPRCLWAVVAGLAFLPCTSFAEEGKDVRQQVQFWGSLNSTTRLTDRLGVIGDVHVRRNDFLEKPSFTLLRFGGQYWVSEKLTLALGYGHMWHAPTCEDCDTWANENRIYEQAQYAARIGKVSVLQRVRNEQRWKQVVENDALTGETAFTNRVRYLVSFTIPVSKNPSVPSVVVADEVALQFGSSIVYNTFDQNRLFLGIKKAMGRAWSFDLGYMLVYQQKSSGFQYDLNHTLRWFFYHAPDKRKPSSHQADGKG